MSPFYKGFLKDTGGWDAASSQEKRFLAAFGKHPGWNDHMDDLQLQTESLLTLKRLLYLQGIAHNISARAWNLDPNEPAPFNHLFRWQRREQFLLGRIHASRDGKGRAYFPFVLCAHLIGDGLPSTQVLEGCLEAILERCLGSESDAMVREELENGLIMLRAAEAELTEASTGLDIDSSLEEAGLDFKVFAPGKFQAKKSPPALRFRIGESVPLEQCMVALRRTKIDSDVPILLIAPLHVDATWTDVIVGEPSAGDFGCLLNGTGG